MVIESHSKTKLSLRGQIYVSSVPDQRPIEALFKAVETKPKLSWRPTDVGDERVLGYLSRKSANTK